MKTPQTLEEQWIHYLELMKLNPNAMNSVQYIETKRAFIGGFSQMLVFGLQELNIPTTEENFKIINKYYTDLQKFWLDEGLEYLTKSN